LVMILGHNTLDGIHGGFLWALFHEQKFFHAGGRGWGGVYPPGPGAAVLRRGSPLRGRERPPPPRPPPPPVRARRRDAAGVCPVARVQPLRRPAPLGAAKFGVILVLFLH